MISKSRRLLVLLPLFFAAFFSAIDLSAEQPVYTAGNVAFKVEPAWKEAPVSSQMRAYQFNIPRADDDKEDAELAVFYFGPDQGGTVEANIERWTSQFDTSDQQPGKEVKPVVTEKKVNGLDVTLVSLQGLYSGMSMSAPPAPPKPDFAFLCAIVKGPKGPVFFKMVGPRNTVEKARPGFDALIDGLKT